MAALDRDPTAVFANRLGAWVLDIVLVGAGVFAAETFATGSGERFLGRPDACSASGNICVNSGSDTYLLTEGDATTYKLLLAGTLLFAIANYVILQGLTGATIGKFVCGIRTVNARDMPCGIGRALLRTLFSWVDFLCSGLVGIITYLRSQNHRRVADMIGGTTVVKKAYLRRKGDPPRSSAYRFGPIVADAAIPTSGVPFQQGYPAPAPGVYPPAQPTYPAGPPSPGVPDGATPAPPGFGGATWPPRPAEPADEA